MNFTLDNLNQSVNFTLYLNGLKHMKRVMDFLLDALNEALTDVANANENEAAVWARVEVLTDANDSLQKNYNRIIAEKDDFEREVKMLRRELDDARAMNMNRPNMEDHVGEFLRTIADRWPDRNQPVIPAIKMVRALFGLGLRDAKEFVLRYMPLLPF